MKKAFVLGGSGDIGRAVAAKFRQEGFAVIAPTSEGLDLADQASIDAYFKKNKPQVQALVHCAGINHPKNFEKLKHSDLLSAINVNSLGFVRVVQHLAPALASSKKGRIVALSSIYGVISRPGRMPYSMSKHALVGIVQTLALELGPKGVLANCISPGFVDTRLTRQNNDAATIRRLVEAVPLGRLAKPEEIAEAVFFLCSEKNGFINGHNLVVDGGYLAGGFQK